MAGFGGGYLGQFGINFYNVNLILNQEWAYIRIGYAYEVSELEADLKGSIRALFVYLVIRARLVGSI